ncbi:response regulator [Dehalogenimonas etheniformans]|uniref:response regulator n=1 Tax=Dehalogenimonas etheniformans TaxID=1536648 RepID=UPI000CCB8967|nr:response regulator [Dehalogenimonas etheniformans]QNT75917.1 hypothetical protein HX448_04045 [Dehalogenimonas etheniformans]
MKYDTGILFQNCSLSNIENAQYFSNDLPILILLDLETLGIANLKKILALIHDRICTIILADSSIDPKLLLNALDSGASDYLFKPINKSELLQLIKHRKEEERRADRIDNLLSNDRSVFDCG